MQCTDIMIHPDLRLGESYKNLIFCVPTSAVSFTKKLNYIEEHLISSYRVRLKAEFAPQISVISVRMQSDIRLAKRYTHHGT